MFASLLATLGAGQAAGADRCRFVVDERSHIDGPCKIERHRGGGFGIEAMRRSRAFAVVYVAPSGAARAYWNGLSGARKADVDLGDVERAGACWSNARAMICAWADRAWADRPQGSSVKPFEERARTR
ncbi:hypothetical protein [Bosea vaviloviae]|uniref:Uncharacterized protein n=1 Tax=Bosea vaviloviae TaxID=1526658 RepID=A0A1D7U303_9HYPH|nr:hypothetical protein [Bosea vaviloviae]AOO81722.1 hypothetical protein BHK69_15815 [Bosea vaviloviae]